MHQEIHRWASADPGDTLNSYKVGGVCMCVLMHMCMCILFALRKESIAFIRISKGSQTESRLSSIELLWLPKCLAHFMYLQNNFLSNPQN